MPFVLLLLEKFASLKFRIDHLLAILLFALTISHLALAFFWQKSVRIGDGKHSIVIIICSFIGGISNVYVQKMFISITRKRGIS